MAWFNITEVFHFTDFRQCCLLQKNVRSPVAMVFVSIIISIIRSLTLVLSRGESKKPNKTKVGFRNKYCSSRLFSSRQTFSAQRNFSLPFFD